MRSPLLVHMADCKSCTRDSFSRASPHNCLLYVLNARTRTCRTYVREGDVSGRNIRRESRSVTVTLPICPSVCLSVCLSVRLSVCPSVRLSVCLSVRLSVRRYCRHTSLLHTLAFCPGIKTDPPRIMDVLSRFLLLTSFPAVASEFFTFRASSDDDIVFPSICSGMSHLGDEMLR